jgi:hypothetical protein
MKTATIQELKKELSELPAHLVLEYCLKLAKYKKENKELLNYLLFESHNNQDYLVSVKEEIDELFTTVNQHQVYFAKKTLRKILRFCNKCIKHSSNKEMEIEILIHFCKKFQQTSLPISTHAVLFNMLQSQYKKIEIAIASLHPDLQFDFTKRLQLI